MRPKGCQSGGWCPDAPYWRTPTWRTQTWRTQTWRPAREKKCVLRVDLKTPRVWADLTWRGSVPQRNATSWQYYKKGFKNALCKEKGLSCFDKTLQPRSAETLSRWPSHSPLLSLSVKRSPLATQSINTNLALHASHSRLLLFAPPQSQSKHTQPFPPPPLHEEQMCQTVLWLWICDQQYQCWVTLVAKTQGFFCNGNLMHAQGNIIYEHWHRMMYMKNSCKQKWDICGDNWEWSAI